MPGAREYRAPALNRRVRVRDPARQPARPTGPFGRPVGPVPEWGDLVWASRRDLSPVLSVDDLAVLREQSVIFTMRNRAVPANVEIVDGGVVFVAQGPPVERGRRGGGASHVEIHAKRRA